MTKLPFTLSDEAASWLETQLCNAQREPRLAGLVPILCYATNFLATDKHGKILGGYDGGHFVIGWDPPEVVSSPEFMELELVGFKVFAHSSTINKFHNRHLEFKAVNCRPMSDFEFLIIKYERDVLKQAVRMKTLPKIGEI